MAPQLNSNREEACLGRTELPHEHDEGYQQRATSLPLLC